MLAPSSLALSSKDTGMPLNTAVRNQMVMGRSSTDTISARPMWVLSSPSLLYILKMGLISVMVGSSDMVSTNSRNTVLNRMFVLVSA